MILVLYTLFLLHKVCTSTYDSIHSWLHLECTYELITLYRTDGRKNSKCIAELDKLC